MLSFHVVVLTVSVVVCVVFYTDVVEGSSNENDGASNPGSPLYLTPLIEKGHISVAVKKATVKPFLKGVKSYAGYFTVDKAFGSNLFVWFFPAATATWEKEPVCVWLQGGPGGSSLLALFIENGPYALVNSTLHRRYHSWHKSCNLVYIDNPVGTGFSFTGGDGGYTRNQTIIGEQLYTAIKQFFTMFPKLLKNDFYLTGESYAGKYVPAFGYAIHKHNAVSKKEIGVDEQIRLSDNIFINLKGLFIGNGLVDPANMMVYGDYLYQLGLIDTNTLKQFHVYENKIRAAIKDEKWSEATTLFGKLVLHYIYYPPGSLFENATGFHEHYNYYDLNPPDWGKEHTAFVESDAFRRAVHVGGKSFNSGSKVAVALQEDVCKTVVDKLELLLANYRVLLYNGQLDVICAYPLTINYVKKMKWAGREEYLTAKRHIWKVKSQIAGYYKTGGNLTEVLVRDAGHMVPSEQPLWAHTLFHKFVHNQPLNDDQTEL